jgi:hypothetical protein
VRTCNAIDLGPLLRVVFSGAPVVSHVVEAEYPHERRANVWKHNHEVHKWLAKYYRQVLYVDFWNLTAYGILNIVIFIPQHH